MAQNAQSQGLVTIAIVCGYDLDSDLGAYVGRVAERLEGIHLDAIVLSGGRTHPKIDSSEAREMSRHLAELRPHGTVLLDHEAMTTLDNLVHARELVRQSFTATHDYLVCCDVAHAVKAYPPAAGSAQSAAVHLAARAVLHRRGDARRLPAAAALVALTQRGTDEGRHGKAATRHQAGSGELTHRRQLSAARGR